MQQPGPHPRLTFIHNFLNSGGGKRGAEAEIENA